MTRFGPRQEVEAKGRGNFLTAADLEAERLILDALRSEYPGHAVLSEETAAKAPGDGWLWVVDPLDGTHNFSRGIPYFCVSIALCYDGEPLLGLTYDPVRDGEFLATRGNGLTVNGQSARSSTAPSLKTSMLAMDLGYDDRRASRAISLLHELWPGVQSVRILGSAALGMGYAACGRYDLFVHHMLYPWDVAAGIVLVKEGGGAIHDRDGGPITIHSESVVAGASKAVEEFLALAKGKAWRE
jgi:fructose-1,6-bisphosphatase/inositol monophosphatase family enzyme